MCARRGAGDSRASADAIGRSQQTIPGAAFGSLDGFALSDNSGNDGDGNVACIRGASLVPTPMCEAAVQHVHREDAPAAAAREHSQHTGTSTASPGDRKSVV